MSTTNILAPWERKGVYVQLQDHAVGNSIGAAQATSIDGMTRFHELSRVTPHAAKNWRRHPITGSGLALPQTGHKSQGIPNPAFALKGPVTALFARYIFALWGQNATEADPSVVTEYTDPQMLHYAAIAAQLAGSGSYMTLFKAFDCWCRSFSLTVPPVREGDGGSLEMTANIIGGYGVREGGAITAAGDDGTDFGQAYDVVFTRTGSDTVSDMHSAEFNFNNNAVKGPTRDTTNDAPESNHLGVPDITVKLKVPTANANEEAESLMEQYEAGTNVKYVWTWTAGSFGTGNAMAITLYTEIDEMPVEENDNGIEVLSATLKVVDDGTNAPYTLSTTTGAALAYPTA